MPPSFAPSARRALLASAAILGAGFAVDGAAAQNYVDLHEQDLASLSGRIENPRYVLSMPLQIPEAGAEVTYEYVWTAPWVDVEPDPSNPNRVFFTFPPEQRLEMTIAGLPEDMKDEMPTSFGYALKADNMVFGVEKKGDRATYGGAGERLEMVLDPVDVDGLKMEMSALYEGLEFSGDMAADMDFANFAEFDMGYVFKMAGGAIAMQMVEGYDGEIYGGFAMTGDFGPMTGSANMNDQSWDGDFAGEDMSLVMSVDEDGDGAPDMDVDFEAGAYAMEIAMPIAPGTSSELAALGMPNISGMRLGLSSRDAKLALPPEVGPFGGEFGEFNLMFDIPMRKSETPQKLSFDLGLVDLNLAEGLWAMVDPGGSLKRELKRVRVAAEMDALVTVDLMSDPEALDDVDTPFVPTNVKITEVALEALGAAIHADGAFDISTGTPVGAGKVVLDNWREVVTQLGALGLIPPNELMMAQGMIEGFSKPGATADQSIIEIEMKDGMMLVNGAPMGPAPSLQ